MSKHSILDEIPEVVRDKVQRALRNIERLSDETIGMGECSNEELDAAMAPDQEILGELRVRRRAVSSFQGRGPGHKSDFGHERPTEPERTPREHTPRRESRGRPDRRR